MSSLPQQLLHLQQGEPFNTRLHYITFHLADTFIQSDLQQVELYSSTFLIPIINETGVCWRQHGRKLNFSLKQCHWMSRGGVNITLKAEYHLALAGWGL